MKLVISDVKDLDKINIKKLKYTVKVLPAFCPRRSVGNCETQKNLISYI